MSKDNFLGGFRGTPNGAVSIGQAVNSGSYTDGDQFKMASAGSWPTSGNLTSGVGTYIRASDGPGVIQIPSDSRYIFVSACGGGGSGAHDNDCRNQGPGAPGGAGKAIVDKLSASAVNINYNVGAGGGGVAGNDATGRPGGSSVVTVGNFTLVANGGGGGPNGNNQSGSPGNASFNGPTVDSSTSSVFAPSAFESRSENDVITYLSMPTGAPGSGGRCGNNQSSSPGADGFIYIRYGAGINANATVSPGQEPDNGPTQAYTPNYD